MASTLRRLLIAGLFASIDGKTGTETMCIGTKPHKITYDIDGESMEEVQNMNISVEPDRTIEMNCSGTSGKLDGTIATMCIGGNVDKSSCDHAAKDLPINDYVDCKNCFVGVATDLYYSIKVEWLKLKEVQVGLRNTHVRAGLEFHSHSEAAFGPTMGKQTLISDRYNFTANFKVAGIVPVDIVVGIPTTLRWALRAKGEIDTIAGADLDIDLGDHYITYRPGSGWKPVNGASSLTATPKFEYSIEAEAGLYPSLESALQINVDKVISYNLNLNPDLPITIDASTGVGEICLTGGADFNVSHEADVHFTLFGKEHHLAHMDETSIYSYHKNPLFRKCHPLPTTTSTPPLPPACPVCGSKWAYCSSPIVWPFSGCDIACGAKCGSTCCCIEGWGACGKESSNTSTALIV